MTRRELAKTLDLEKELRPLKDFQRRTVEHVVERLYGDAKTSRRFLVADEVGLGKTMVARGVIAHAIDRLRGTVPRIDVVYVCSNAAIAQQNLNRLNVLQSAETTLATRLTLLPEKIESLDAQDVNFVSFTPGTTFDLKSRGGIKEERAIIHCLLEGHLGLTRVPLRNVLQANVGDDAWDRALEDMRSAQLSQDLGARFRQGLADKPEVLERVRDACRRFARRRETVPGDDREVALRVTGELRATLARACVRALEPDLVILDEFQRFKDLLDGPSEAAELARALFEYENVRVLLLSATPYRMVTLAHESDENHQEDFLSTFQFLNGGDAGETAALAEELEGFRHALHGTHGWSEASLLQSRAVIERRLSRVMCRTERVGSSHARDAMMEEVQVPCALAPEDIGQARAIDGVSRALGTGDTIEYWKSAPYLLGFMDRYQVKQKLKDMAEKPTEALLEAVQAGAEHGLRASVVKAYQKVPFANPRLRALAAGTIEAGQWRLLWLPPSMPYVQPTGPYADLAESGLTKSLVFSSWTVVPEVIAGLLSYEAERLAVGAAGVASGYERHARSRRPLLTFRVDAEDRATGMPALALLYPSVMLAQQLDPLDIALTEGGGAPVPFATMRAHVRERCVPIVRRLTQGAPTEGAFDQRWYWAAPVMLDARYQREALPWIDSKAGLRGLFDEAESDVEGAGKETGFDRHVDEFLRAAGDKLNLGRPPEDLAEVIADLALASPAVCAVRAMRRVAGASSPTDPIMLTAAARIARGFRVLFNVPETLELLLAGRTGDDEGEPYWRSVLAYCVAGNLQAVLDEYAHLLVESEGVMGHGSARIADRVSQAILRALSPRTTNLAVDEVVCRPRKATIEVETFRMRCRFALRYGKLKSESDEVLARAEVVRDAFNSPFRPFVLASTSVGQEGLDFHRYCHAVVHWNLPSNPVDLEQREGRVHRYKGHAVRRNLAKHYGLRALQGWDVEGDPWAELFRRAATDRAPGMSDLVPYWIYETEGGARVQRRVPLLPMSREHGQLDRLKKSLALYRLVFGQARQGDLLAFLGDRADAESLDRYRISLEPPSTESSRGDPMASGGLGDQPVSGQVGVEVHGEVAHEGPG